MEDLASFGAETHRTRTPIIQHVRNDMEMAETTLKKPRGRPRTFARDHALDVAFEGYWREGLYGMSVNEVCRRAGVSKPGLYRAYGSEDGLTDAVLRRYEETVTENILGLVSGNRPFAEVLRDLVWALTEVGDAPAGCLLAKMRSAVTVIGPNTQARIELVRGKVLGAYAGWIRHARARGEINPEVSDDLATGYLDTQLTTVLTRMAAREDPATIRAEAALAFSVLTKASLGWWPASAITSA